MNENNENRQGYVVFVSETYHQMNDGCAEYWYENYDAAIEKAISSVCNLANKHGKFEVFIYEESEYNFNARKYHHQHIPRKGFVIFQWTNYRVWPYERTGNIKDRDKALL